MVNEHENQLPLIENTLSECLCHLLESEAIAKSDNIFEHGVDSVIAAMFINRIREKFQVELPLVTVFRTPTIEALAHAVQDLQQAN